MIKLKGTINDSTLGAIANSLRRKTQTDDLILPHNMSVIIDNLKGAEDKLISVLVSNQYINLDHSFMINVVIKNMIGEGVSGKEVTIGEVTKATDNKGIARF